MVATRSAKAPTRLSREELEVRKVLERILVSVEKNVPREIERDARAAAKAQHAAEARVRHRRADARAADKLLAEGRCHVRLRVRSLKTFANRQTDPHTNKQKRAAMRKTCWVWCSDNEQWHNPVRFFGPEELAAGARHAPQSVLVGNASWKRRRTAAARGVAHRAALLTQLRRRSTPEPAAPAVGPPKITVSLARLQQPAPPPPEPAEKLSQWPSRDACGGPWPMPKADWDALLKVATRPATGESSDSKDEEGGMPDSRRVHVAQAIYDLPGVKPVPSADAPPPAQRARPGERPDTAAIAAAEVADAAHVEWEHETALARAERQKAHGYKGLLGMSDAIFYKHLRDNVLTHEEAHAEVHKRKCCIRAGTSGQYAVPEGVHPMGKRITPPLRFRLFGVAEDDPKDLIDLNTATAPRHNPWVAYVQHREAVRLTDPLVRALEAFSTGP